MLRKAWRDPHLLQARAQGISTLRLVRAHILPSISSQLLALATLSIVTALSALVPVEVIFQRAWLGSAGVERGNEPRPSVLLAVTMIMAIAVHFRGNGFGWSAGMAGRMTSRSLPFCCSWACF